MRIKTSLQKKKILSYLFILVFLSNSLASVFALTAQASPSKSQIQVDIIPYSPSEKNGISNPIVGDSVLDSYLQRGDSQNHKNLIESELLSRISQADPKEYTKVLIQFAPWVSAPNRERLIFKY